VPTGLRVASSGAFARPCSYWTCAVLLLKTAPPGLSAISLPSPTDSPRLFSQGLAFWMTACVARA